MDICCGVLSKQTDQNKNKTNKQTNKKQKQKQKLLESKPFNLQTKTLSTLKKCLNNLWFGSHRFKSDIYIYIYIYYFVYLQPLLKLQPPWDAIKPWDCLCLSCSRCIFSISTGLLCFTVMVKVLAVAEDGMVVRPIQPLISFVNCIGLFLLNWFF